MASNKTVVYLDDEFEVNENVPDTFEEVSALIGADAVVQEAIDNLRYRNKYPRVYKAVSKRLTEDHAFPVAVVGQKTNKDGTKKDIKESPNDHIRAFLFGRKDEDGKISVAAPEENRVTLATIFDEVANSEPLYVKGERAIGGGKVSQAALDAANQFHAAGAAKVEAVVNAIESQIPGYKVLRDGDGEVTPESVARGIQALGKHQERIAQKAALASLQAAGVGE